MNLPSPSSRRRMRFPPDPNTLATLTMVTSPDGPPWESSSSPMVGLAVNESYDGCSLVMRADASLKIGAWAVLSLGQLDPVPAELMWIRELEPGIIRVGLRMRVD